MKTIATIQFKGGVGKTTTLFALTSAAVARGQRVKLIDTDQNRPMEKWRVAAVAGGNWSDLVSVESHLDYEPLYEAALAAEDSGDVDYFLIDPRAGRSEFMLGVAQLADALILPTRPVKVDADALIETMRMLGRFEEDGNRVAPCRPMFCSIKSESQLSAGALAYRDILVSRLPVMKARLQERVAYQNMQALGLLGKIAEGYLGSGNPLERRQAQHYDVALEEALTLLDEVDEMTSEESDE